MNSINNSNETKIKAVGYCRFSSNNQREESITAQKRFIIMFAQQYGYEITEWYSDEAKSGKTAERPAFQKLIHDVESGDKDFSTVIVHKLDRFSRSVTDTLNYKHLFSDYGIDVVSASEKLDNSPSGNLMLTIMSGLNEYYNQNLAAEVMKGLKENAYKAEFTGGVPALGYDIIDNKYVINEDEAKTIRMIYSLLADGYGYGYVVEKLNALGYKTKRGNSFGKNSVYDLIRNEKYKGVYTFNKAKPRRKSDNKKNAHIYKDDSEIIRVKGGCPAIVSEELWDRVNKLRNISKGTNAIHPYLLTGLIYCSKCGKKMHGDYRTYPTGGGYAYYECSTKTNNHTCNCKPIRSSYLDSFVIENIFQQFYNPQSIQIISECLNKKLLEAADNNAEYSDAKKNLKLLEKQYDNLVSAIANLGANERISAKIELIEQQQETCRKIIANCEQESEKIITNEEIKERLDKLKTMLINPEKETLNRLKVLLTQFIDRIDVNNDEIKVTFKVAFSYASNNSDIADNSDNKCCVIYYVFATVDRDLIFRKGNVYSPNTLRFIENLKSMVIVTHKKHQPKQSDFQKFCNSFKQSNHEDGISKSG